MSDVMIIPPTAEIIASPSYEEAVYIIERAARTCYQSQPKAGPSLQASKEFIARLIRRGHHSVLEHVVVTVRCVTDRGVSHELVRHRVGVAFSQESTRYVRQTGTMYVIRPWWWNESTENLNLLRCQFAESCTQAARAYQTMLAAGASPQQARAVLPHALKTEIVVTANLREWRHIFSLRCAPEAHPDMRDLMSLVLREMYGRYPVFFEDVFALTGGE